MDKDRPTIEIKKHGPYKVSGIKNLKNSAGKTLNSNEVMYLCKCGSSKNMPYCDGTHLKIGLSDEKEPDRVPDKSDTYKGRSININDNSGVCSHRGHCTGNLPSVFKSTGEPWIDPDAASVDEIARVIEMCPSGALSYTKDGILHKDQDRKPEITVSKDGPYEVIGGPELIDPYSSRPESREHYTLCRCGHSKNKPFCDGQHQKIKFRDPKN
jgi:CDGSH-type Zn-finger protein